MNSPGKLGAIQGKPGKNCWQAEFLSRVSLDVDLQYTKSPRLI